MFHTFLSRLWKLFAGSLQWRLLWIFHSKFIIGVSAVIIDPNRNVLLLRHAYWKVGSWGLPSGYAVKGESLQSAIKREIKEETGLDAEIGRLLQVKSGFRLRIELTFVGRPGGSMPEVRSGEILEARFFSISNLPNGLLPSHRELILRAFALPADESKAHLV
jgi:8-oxo-dGTP diphosphatase